MYALYVTAAGGGARPGELLGVPDNAVDLPARRLHLHQTLVRAGRDPVLGPNKTRRGRRTILLPDEAVEAIGAALRWKKEQRLKYGQRFRDAGLIFCGPYGRPINPSNLRNRDHLPRLARLGLPRSIRPHDFRHLHATYLIAAGVDPRTVADRLGHASPSFTLAIYAHAATRAQEQAASIANELLMKSSRSVG
jgi:integrase